MWAAAQPPLLEITAHLQAAETSLMSKKCLTFPVSGQAKDQGGTDRVRFVKGSHVSISRAGDANKEYSQLGEV